MEQFVWTKKFNRIWSCFCDEVPVNANRHYFRSFPNSFSGRSAIDVMEKVLSDIFPGNDIQRYNAQKVLELFLRDGLIIGLHKVDQIKDEKDVFYRFGKQPSEKYASRPRRSVSVDDNRKRFAQERISIISPDHCNSEPEICAPSTSANSASNSMENVNEDIPKPNQMEVNAAALRFLKWINEDRTLSDRQRQKTLKAFKEHYPLIYHNFSSQPRKSPSVSSAPQCIMSYRKQNSLIEFPKTPDSPSISHYSMQFELARSIDELNSGPQRKLTSRISEADFNDQLLKKLDSVIENPIYTETDRQRIFKYYKHTFPVVYHQRFSASERPLLKKIREFLPRISIGGEIR